MSEYSNNDEGFLAKMAAIHQNPGRSASRFEGTEIVKSWGTEAPAAAATGTQAPAAQKIETNLTNG